MLKYGILAQVEKDRKMEAELEQLREQQEQELQELDRVRREMETAVEEELQGKTLRKWTRCPGEAKDRTSK